MIVDGILKEEHKIEDIYAASKILKKNKVAVSITGNRVFLAESTIFKEETVLKTDGGFISFVLSLLCVNP